MTRRLEHAPEGRRIAAVQVALAGLGALPDEVDVLGGVEGQQLGLGGDASLLDVDPAMQSPGLELALERAVPVRAEGMPVGEAVAGELFAGDHEDIGTHRSVFAAFGGTERAG